MAGAMEYAGGHQAFDVLIRASLLAERAPENVTPVKRSTGGVAKDHVYRCPVKTCGKTFTKNWNLKVHVRLHTGDEPFKCSHENCRKTFRWRSSLKSHEKTHENTSGRRKALENVTPVDNTESSESVSI
mmetsp:Transcript_3575/g.10772  ORF Transcript_3575/g.10772 Transcript_3575/m.10772 type:complete len:129 (+) Transcript_3575:111-497(+)|eukprot:CAMPEP_0198722658 /NCGR_PEP_ID=MMETSP1475-20131203/299_1 /TAXON_ID= ORGANISM="Unidentified sp., Strain CCMP1999" /NCGR_SAMPLE_ID=MMETSP1475 /ASSEMBLY_ACC=CAM_ASM_001111 /LENGTH=128 /DNA_ID=CAMNT_0044483569 /DNA_START=106 /DNA_END=492 /DNA_ORIENTATION=-